MPSSKVYVGDIGTVIETDVGSDVTGATTLELRVTKPDASLATWVATINGGNNNQIDYTTISGDFDQAGDYKIQAYVVTASGTWRGETVILPVFAIFK